MNYLVAKYCVKQREHLELRFASAALYSSPLLSTGEVAGACIFKKSQLASLDSSSAVFLHYSADGTSFILLRKQKTPVVTEHTQFVKGNSGFALVCTTRVG